MFVTVRNLSPRWLGVVQELPSLWLSSRKFVLLYYVWGLIMENQIDLGSRSEQFRVERNPILCGHLNEHIRIFVVPNFRNKSCVFCA
jgi:hypothetical protein